MNAAAFTFSHLDLLEAESIYILREVIGQFERPLFLYSAGKDSSVLLHLMRKAFSPGRVPFPLLHIDTGYKFKEMYEFRDRTMAHFGLTLHVRRNEAAIKANTSPFSVGSAQCCAALKTTALLNALKEFRCDAAIGGARRDEERARAKERIFSFRNTFGQWEPRDQRPELWHLLNGALIPGESIRVFPLSNWTERDIWEYIVREDIEVAPLYFATRRKVVRRDNQLMLYETSLPLKEGEQVEEVLCRFRTLGCYHCSAAIPSPAASCEDILSEMDHLATSERSTRAIDHDRAHSMEIKKREGYF